MMTGKSSAMSTSAPAYSYAKSRENSTLVEDGGSESLEDMILQLKMACRPIEELEEGNKEARDSDYDTDIDEDEARKTPFDNYGRRTYLRTCRKLGVTPITSLARDLSRESISIRHRGLAEKDVLAVANALLDNTAVHEVTIEGNVISEKACRYICLALAENLYVTTLHLPSNNLCGKCAALIADLLAENQVIRKLDISENNFLDVDAVHFQRILTESHHLQELNLSHNNLGDEAAKLIGQAIGSNDYLKVLDLSWNQLRPTGAELLCKGMEENVSLHTLNLGYNGLANSGAKALAGVLKVNVTLIELDVTCNRIYDEGAFLMAKALETNEYLKVLKISQNPLTNLGALAVMAGVQSNATSVLCLVDMTSVNVYHNTVAISRELNQSRKGFRLIHGYIMDEILKVKEASDEGTESPLLLLQWYMDLKHINLLTVFEGKAFEGIVSREEFKTGLKSIKAPLTEHQLTQLMDSIDAAQDNTVNLNAIINAPRKKEKTALPR